MRWRRLQGSVTSIAAAALVGAMLVACKEEGLANGEACYPGDFEYADASVAADGARVASYLRCSDDGAAYEPYDGDPNATVDAEADAYVSCDLAAGLLTFMCPGCSTDDQCTTGHCQIFNNKGNHCSHVCKNDTDCDLSRSGGCGNNGYCKPQ